jgi:hypothetical protein
MNNLQSSGLSQLRKAGIKVVRVRNLRFHRTAGMVLVLCLVATMFASGQTVTTLQRATEDKR